jgi:two-component system, chemotaxis family, chemotaxis protein CheY
LSSSCILGWIFHLAVFVWWGLPRIVEEDEVRMAKALVVDDAAFLRMTIKRILEPAGFEVEEAEDGSVAVEVYDTFQPDVVTMDITMPVKNGIEAVKEIISKDPGAKIIMVTALGQEQMVVDAITAGAKSFIVKPFQPDRLLHTINETIG